MSNAAEFVKQARALVASQTLACLSTIYRESGQTSAGSIQDFPFGSIVPFRIRKDGSPLLFLARIAEHTKNIQGDPRASLLVSTGLATQVTNSPRLTILARFAPASLGEDPETEENLASTVPADLTKDFVLLAGHIVRLRWVGGFAAAGWIDPKAWKGSFGV